MFISHTIATRATSDNFCFRSESMCTLANSRLVPVAAAAAGLLLLVAGTRRSDVDFSALTQINSLTRAKRSSTEGVINREAPAALAPCSFLSSR